MASEDYLREVTIGNLAELSGKIILQEYNPRWEQMFRQQEERIRQALHGKKYTLNMSAPPPYQGFAQNRSLTFSFL